MSIRLFYFNLVTFNNLSQFFITFDKCDFLDGKHVVFGEVSGGNDLLPKMEEAGSKTEEGKPKKKITIAECGQLDYCSLIPKSFQPKKPLFCTKSNFPNNFEN